MRPAMQLKRTPLHLSCPVQPIFFCSVSWFILGVSLETGLRSSSVSDALQYK